MQNMKTNCIENEIKIKNRKLEVWGNCYVSYNFDDKIMRHFAFKRGRKK